MLHRKDADLPSWLARRLITVGEYHKMAEVGILTEEDRVELIEGQIIAMSPIGSEHSGRVNRLNQLLVSKLGDHAIVSVRNSVRLSDILEPEPDFAILKPRRNYYADRLPNAQDVLLLIEVADTSLDYDRGVKARLYARHGIQEFWIVSVRERSVTVHRDPRGDAYTSMSRVAAPGTLTIAAFPEVSLQASDIFPD